MGTPLRVAIRADASSRIGHGHVMRGLALAAALFESGPGADVHVLQRAAPGDAQAAVDRAGCRAIALPADPDGRCGAADDAAATRAALAPIRPDLRPHWLVLDHYRLGADWVQTLRDVADRVLVIDDLADRPHEGDLLLDSNWHDDPAARYRGLWPADRPMLLGPHYALLRPEFAAARTAQRPRDGTLRRVVVAFGGSDPAGATAPCVDRIQAAFPGLHIDVIVGAASAQAPSLVRRWAGHPSVHVTVGAQDVAARFGAADAFVGAGGSMTWERACLGLPGITLPIADNQQPLCRRLHEAGEGIDLGPWQPDATGAQLDALEAALRTLHDHPVRLQAMGQGLARRCDGQGARRVAAAMRDAVASRGAEPA